MLRYMSIVAKKGYFKASDEGYREFIERMKLTGEFNLSDQNQFISLWLEAYYDGRGEKLTEIDKILDKMKKHNN